MELETQAIANSSVTVLIEGDGLDTDYCGAGHKLKAAFTLRVSKELAGLGLSLSLLHHLEELQL